MRKLTPIQRLAIKAVLECYRTTPTAAMEVETATDLTPKPRPCNHADAITLRETSNTRMANKCVANKNRLHLTPIELRKHTATVFIYV
jgi:hypothetical protein